MEQRSKKQRRQRSPPSPAPAATSVSAVLGNDDLLSEILLRLGFATTLVNAAAVSKRWLRNASDGDFLRQFRARNPPPLLGFYPPPPELASVLRRASFGFDAYENESASIIDCRNSSVLVNLRRSDGGFTRGVHSPLHPERDLVAVTLPQPIVDRGNGEYMRGRYDHDGGHGDPFNEAFSQEDGDGRLSYFGLAMEYGVGGEGEVPEDSICHVYRLQDDGAAWHIHCSATTRLDQHEYPPPEPVLLAHDKIYMAGSSSRLHVLDMASSTFFTIELPDEVLGGCIKLALADNSSGFSLLSLKEFRLQIWSHNGDSSGVSGWSLVDTICLRKMLSAGLGISVLTSEGCN
ncbi:hypothetical protein E2562_010323 [Oryza meyeriana var. granulata]|uniref:F-box protein AT5G49610-like beta-propeller domain-containing protein n=1 Tax=Oryza meyeriana var. granulata TaxID=110450 RepID=A0A6G1F656_9ORYZ|nr:hypothetical protein E2562_010323 [Oryza meyeriana var. granulata]